jgi:YesN/AraC family two-component response regulator
MKKKWRDLLRSLLGRRGVKSKGGGLESGEADYIQHRLELYMLEKKPYLQPRFTIKQLSESIQIPAHRLSAVINARKRSNFTDYLNRLRVRHCEELIRNSGGSKINIQRLAGECGFHNRNTFTTAFKKFTGRTPSEYLRRQE